MGFKARRTYVLEFAEGTPLHGATVKCKGMPGGKVVQFKAKVDATPHDQMFELMASQLVGVIKEWDFEEDDGQPISVSLENIAELEMDQMMCLYEAWLNAVVGVRPSLGKGSDSGGKPPEALIMSTVNGSPDHLNSPTQTSSSESLSDSLGTPTAS